MDDSELNELLKSYAKAPIPELPGSFPHDVLREVRLRAEGRHREGWLAEMYGLLFRPGVVAVSVCLAVLVGVGYPARMGARNRELTVNGLGLEVFSRSMIEAPGGMDGGRP